MRESIKVYGTYYYPIHPKSSFVTCGRCAAIVEESLVKRHEEYCSSKLQVFRSSNT